MSLWCWRHQQHWIEWIRSRLALKLLKPCLKLSPCLFSYKRGTLISGNTGICPFLLCIPFCWEHYLPFPAHDLAELLQPPDVPEGTLGEEKATLPQCLSSEGTDQLRGAASGCSLCHTDRCAPAQPQSQWPRKGLFWEVPGLLHPLKCWFLMENGEDSSAQWCKQEELSSSWYDQGKASSKTKNQLQAWLLAQRPPQM